MAEIDDLNVLDASNTARFPEGQAPSTLNDGNRALEGIIARWDKDTNGSLVSTGSANAYAVAANRALSAYYDGLVIVFDANFSNTAAATLNVDSVGAANIVLQNGQAVKPNNIVSGQKVVVIYDGTSWQLLNPSRSGTFLLYDDSADALGNPVLDLQRDSASPAANDILGVFRFFGEDDASLSTQYAQIYAQIVDPSTTAEAGALILRTAFNGALADVLRLRQGAFTPNATGGDRGADTINADGLFINGNPLYSFEGGLETEQATTTGTFKDFTGIRSDAKRITIIADSVSLTDTSSLAVQIGDSGGLEATGYVSSSAAVNDAAATSVLSATTGFAINSVIAANAFSGHMTLINISGNTWVSSHTGAGSSTQIIHGGGVKTLSAVLDRVRFRVNGAGAFDAGAVNILVE